MPEGAPQAGAGGARNATPPGAYPADGTSHRRGRRDSAASSRFLSPAQNDPGPDRPHGDQSAGPVRHPPGSDPALGRPRPLGVVFAPEFVTGASARSAVPKSLVVIGASASAN